MPTHPIASYKKHERLFALYQCLPRDKNQAISLSELMKSYGQNPASYLNERKNLENDLIALHQLFNNIFYSDALVRIPAWGQNISGQTARYYIEPSFSIDVQDKESLFFWEMLNNYTAHYLPTEVRKSITNKLTQVRRQDKAKYHNTPLGQWHQHLVTLPSVLQAPSLNKEVLESVHQALLHSKQLRINYFKKWSQTPVERVIYPKGIVFIDNMMYLTGFNPVEDSIDDNKLLKAHRNFAMTRIKSAYVMDKNIPDWVNSDGLSLESLKQLGKLELTENTEVKLVLKVQKYACQHLYERPLSKDQRIEVIDTTWNKVTATVSNTQRLQDWLVSMSQLAVVIEPKQLKTTILERLQSGIALYNA